MALPSLVVPLHSHYNCRLLCLSRTPSLLPLNLRRPSNIRQAQVVRSRFRVVAAQRPDLLKAVGTIWKTSKDVLETGSKLVPESVPRPVARVGVAIGGLVVILFILKSVVSTALFILAVVGLIYFVFIYLNKDEGPRASIGDDEGATNETLDEARRIMDKYK